TSAAEEYFRDITRGVSAEDVLGEDLRYARAREKGDKSLEMYKFHINALYVAVTRAVENLYLIEANPGQRLFEGLGLKLWEDRLARAEGGSSLEEWRQEARRLELQGKQEQADAIRTQILKLKDVPWQVLQGETLRTLERQAFDHDDKQAKLLLFEYALVYQDRNRMQALAERGFRPATQPDRGIKPLTQKYFFPYELKKPEAMLRQVDQYGVDFRNPFNQTPLMIAARLGNDDQVARLVAMGADTSLINNVGFNAFQIVLEQACIDAHYAARKLAGVYDTLAPLDMVIQVDGRLVKLDKRSMEVLLLNLLMPLFYTHLGDKVVRFGGGRFQQWGFCGGAPPLSRRTRAGATQTTGLYFQYFGEKRSASGRPLQPQAVSPPEARALHHQPPTRRLGRRRMAPSIRTALIRCAGLPTSGEICVVCL